MSFIMFSIVNISIKNVNQPWNTVIWDMRINHHVNYSDMIPHIILQRSVTKENNLGAKSGESTAWKTVLVRRSGVYLSDAFSDKVYIQGAARNWCHVTVTNLLDMKPSQSLRQ